MKINCEVLELRLCDFNVRKSILKYLNKRLHHSPLNIRLDLYSREDDLFFQHFDEDVLPFIDTHCDKMRDKTSPFETKGNFKLNSIHWGYSDLELSEYKEMTEEFAKLAHSVSLYSKDLSPY